MFYLYILLIIYYTLGIINFIYINKFKTKYKDKVIRCKSTKRVNNYRLNQPLLESNQSSDSSLNKSSNDSDNPNNILLNLDRDPNNILLNLDRDPNNILDLKEKKVSFNTNLENNKINDGEIFYS